MSFTNFGRIALLTLVLPLSASCQQKDATLNKIPTVPFCELVKNSQQYSGKIVTTTARITRFKHGTGLGDPACPISADLQIEETQRASPDMRQLDEALSRHGISDHPIIATLTGTWMGRQYTDNKFILQPRLVFRVSDAHNVE